jgi:hypothetical protein
MHKQTDAFPTPPRFKRTTLSIPTETAERIERLARRMGVSQSAFVAELLAEPIAAMASIIDALPEQGATRHDVKRARGRSLDLIRNVVSQAQEVLQEVDHPLPKSPRKRSTRRKG